MGVGQSPTGSSGNRSKEVVLDLPPPLRTTRLTVILAVIPVLALTLGIPLANRLEPRVLGLPFLLVYIVVWILMTPAFLGAGYALDRAQARRSR
jgi:hypothetical protein